MLAYAQEHRREKSHIKRIQQHLNRFDADDVVWKALKRYKEAIGIFS